MTGYEVVSYAGLLALGITYCRSHIDRLEKANDFPKSFKLSKSRGGRRMWWLHEVIAWLKSNSHLKKLPIGTMGSRKGKHEICENRFCVRRL
jgi:predicted DNA-binding transcriptional regulator AlpA